MQRFLLSLFLILLCARCATAPTSTDSSPAVQGPFELKVHKETLANGLRVIIWENHKLPIFTYTTFFDVGGRYESKGTTGATHFLEHMMFKGAKKYGPGMFDSLIESSGGNTNAYTTADSTVYYQSLPSKFLPTIIDLEADRMANLLLEPMAFESERKVILEERKFRYENSPQGKLYLGMMQAVFEKTPYGGSVIGDEEDLLALERDQVMAFFKKFYAPNNAVIVIAGDVDAQETMKMIREKYLPIPASNSLESFKSGKDEPALYRHRAHYGTSVNIRAASPNVMFMAAFPGVAINDSQTYALDILASILGSGESSYLFQNYVKSKRPRLNDVSASNINLRNSGVFIVSGQMLPGQSLNQFKSNLAQELKKSCLTKSGAINSRSLQKTKNNYLIGYFQEISSNSGVASFLGMRENFFGDYAHYKEELERYEALTVQDIQKACHQMFDGRQALFVSVWEKHPAAKNDRNRGRTE